MSSTRVRCHFGEGADPRLLGRLTHLRALEVVAPSPAQLEAVATLSRIQELTIVSSATPSLSTVAKMHQLWKLTLRRVGGPDAIDLKPLGAMAVLRELRIEGRSAALGGVAAFTSLELLSLEWPANGAGAAEVEPPAGLKIQHDSPPPEESDGLAEICKIDPTACPDTAIIEDTCRPIDVTIYAVAAN